MNKYLSKQTIYLLSLIFLLSSCSDGFKTSNITAPNGNINADDSNNDPTKNNTDDDSNTSKNIIGFDQINSEIIQAKCAVCHNQLIYPQLSNFTTYEETIKSGAVVKSNLDESSLYKRVIDGSMPPSGPLDTDEIEKIKLWIEGGALEISKTSDDNENNASAAENNKALSISIDQGSSSELVLPINQIELTAKTNLLKDEKYLWKQISGPSTAVLENKTTLKLLAKNLQEGIYKFEIEVSHENKTEKDLISVEVKKALVSASFSELNTKLFQPMCAKCHINENKFDMTSYNTILNHVTKFNYKESDLYISIENGSMPIGGPKVSDELLNKLKEWIENGAPNN